MIMYKGGMVVEKGLYWDPVEGRRINMREDGSLPGKDTAYLKISSAALLVIAPLFGMMYVIFLPLFGIGVFLISWIAPVICTLVSAASTGFRVCSRIDARSAFFNWSPSRSYLSSAGKKAARRTGKTQGNGDSAAR